MRFATFSPILLAITLISPAGTSAQTSPREDAADLILRHGVFYPVASSGAVRGSLVIRGGRIVFLGEDTKALAWAGPKTVQHELAGRTVVPGFLDAHSHLTGLGDALAQVDLTDATTYDEVIRRVVAAAGSLPAGTWVMGRGWDQTRWPERVFPTHERLSAAVPNHPVWLTRVDGHAALVNRVAMTALGIDDQVVDPPGGRFLRDGAGRPTGVLIDAAMNRLGGAAPPSAAVRAERLFQAARHAVALGLTTVTDMGVDDNDIATYQQLAGAGRLPLRAALFLTDNPALLERWFARGPELDAGRARVLVRGVKLYSDGALGSRGAALVEPYSDDPGNLGLLITSGDRLRTIAAKALEHGFQVGIHAIGDRGNLVTLDAFEAAFGGQPRPTARFRLEHAQVMRLQDIERAARLGILFSVQPTHATSDKRWAGERVGEGRLEGAYAWRRAVAAGGRLALGSDFPVESANPMLGFYAAVTRQDLDGLPAGGWRAAERLTREEALAGFTRDAAHSLFLDTEVGTLEVGKRADLVVLDRDLMTVPAADLPGTRVLATYVDGERVYSAESHP